jgi:hypothetical protein
MAKRHGRNGALYFSAVAASTPAPYANLSSWNVDFATDQVDVTAFGNVFKEYVTGLPDFSGAFSGFWSDGDATSYAAAVDGVARQFYLYPDKNNAAGRYWYGTAFFDFSITTPVDGAVQLSGNIRGAGGVSSVGIV